MTWEELHLISFGSTEVIALKEGENLKIEVIKVSVKPINYFMFWIFKFLRIFSFLLTFCHVILERTLSSAQKPWYFPKEHDILKELPGQGKVMSEGWQLWSCRVGFGAQIRAHQEERALRQHLGPVSRAGSGESRNHFPGTICMLCRNSRPYVHLEKRARSH